MEQLLKRNRQQRWMKWKTESREKSTNTKLALWEVRNASPLAKLVEGNCRAETTNGRNGEEGTSLLIIKSFHEPCPQIGNQEGTDCLKNPGVHGSERVYSFSFCGVLFETRSHWPWTHRVARLALDAGWFSSVYCVKETEPKRTSFYAERLHPGEAAGRFYQTFMEEVTLILHSLFQKINAEGHTNSSCEASIPLRPLSAVHVFHEYRWKSSAKS